MRDGDGDDAWLLLLVWVGGEGGYTLFVVCGSVGGVGIIGVSEIREVVIIRWGSGQ